MNIAEKDAHRSYQDTPFPDFRKHVGIWADLERLRPQGDCVLIRVIPEPEMHANLIWIPEAIRGKGSNAPRIGEVMAIGWGDRLFWWICEDCAEKPGNNFVRFQKSTWHAPKPCSMCGGRNFSRARSTRHLMHVKLGDWVYYWRVFANQVIIQEQVFQFVREEQHILAIIEKETVRAARAYEDDGHLMYDLSKEGKDGNSQ